MSGQWFELLLALAVLLLPMLVAWAFLSFQARRRRGQGASKWHDTSRRRGHN